MSPCFFGMAAEPSVCATCNQTSGGISSGGVCPSSPAAAGLYQEMAMFKNKIMPMRFFLYIDIAVIINQLGFLFV